MGKKPINSKATRPYSPRKARRREQRRAFRLRFKAFFNQNEPEDMDYYENGLEWKLSGLPEPEDD